MKVPNARPMATSTAVAHLSSCRVSLEPIGPTGGWWKRPVETASATLCKKLLYAAGEHLGAKADTGFPADRHKSVSKTKQLWMFFLGMHCVWGCEGLVCKACEYSLLGPPRPLQGVAALQRALA